MSEKPPNYIDKVGFEIEGGWAGTPGISPFPDISLKREGSINGQTLFGAKPIEAVHIGEAVSPPLNYEKDAWEEWLLSHWPDAEPKHRTNRTCGLHVHISTKSMKDYSLLSSKSFLTQLQTEMVKLGKKLNLPPKHVFWERMYGYNEFCGFDFDPAKQMRVTNGAGNRTRYGYLNYCYRLHGTIEFRALPTFRDGSIALRFISLYFDQVNAYLASVGKVEIKRSAALVG